MKWRFFSVLLISIFTLGFFVQSAVAVECSIDIPDDVSESELKRRLEVCDQEIVEQKILLEEKQREKTSIERDLNIIDYQIRQNQYQINARKLSLTKINSDIEYHESEIESLEAKIERMRLGTAELLRATADIDDRSLIEVMLDEGNVSAFFENLGSIYNIQASLKTAFDELRQAKTEREINVEILAEKFSEEDRLKRVQEIEKAKKVTKESEQKRLLNLTTLEEEKYLEEVAERQKIAGQIKSRILRINGGGELTFGEALVLVRVPEVQIGVRAAFSLAVLTQESAWDGKIGGHLGSCYYNTPFNNGAGTVMSTSQKTAYLYITKQIGIDPNTTPVSCPIPQDGSYGGAMGPAQFMPRTWWDPETQTGYAKRVARLTGSSFANPFDNLDAFTANALYLSDALGNCREIYSSQWDQEACAAARYYSGGNWRKHKSGYGASVANRAIQFQKDIDFLDSQV
ncbi:MAG: hypothetical protein Q8Q18_03675 [bacterium]|nr:hypothetical protein [bacterium]